MKISNNEEKKFAGKAIADKHPRTAIGYTKDGTMIILAIQGRMKGLAANGRALDAIENGARVTEADESNKTVGYGGYPDRDGRVTLDACIMDEKGNCGSVMCLEYIKHPISPSTKRPAPITGESPTRPCILKAMPLVVHPPLKLPWASRANIPMVSWLSMLPGNMPVSGCCWYCLFSMFMTGS